MLLTIQNQSVSLTVDTLGAQMMSIRSADGCEYLWQGDPAYWEDRAPTLFPFIGRLTNDSYKLNGTVYPMGIHGFAAASEFVVAEQKDNSLTLLLSGNAQTKASYPFDFALWITYRLEGSRVLPLRHDLFDDDAIILKNMARQVTLRSDRSSRSVTVSYPDMPYLGIRHWPKTDAPYVCIEPWFSLPARQDVVEEFTCKSDLIQLAPGLIDEINQNISING